MSPSKRSGDETAPVTLSDHAQTTAGIDATLETQAGTEDGLAYFGRFGVDTLMLRTALDRALARGGDFAELFFEHVVGHSVGLEDGAVNRAHTGVSLGVGVRVVQGDQTGYAYTEELTTKSVGEAASTAAIVAAHGPTDGPDAFTLQEFPRYYTAQVPWEQVGIHQKMPVLSRLETIIRGRDDRIAKIQIGFTDSSGALLVVDSSGRMSFDRQPMARLGVSCSAISKGLRESSSCSLAGRQGLEFFDDACIEKAANEVLELLSHQFEASPAPAGEMPIVLGAGSSGILLHEAIGHGMEADFNRKGISVYADKLGQRIAPPDVTIVDDATHPNTRGAINVDDEGTPGQRTVLVENGVLRSYMHDRISAKHYGVEPTGNGRRQSFRSPPVPRMRNTYMLPGPYDPKEIIGSVKRGVYAKTFTNGQVMIGAGDFTFYIKTGFLIEDGKLTQPIKDTNIIGNGPEVLEQTDMVGNDFAFDDGGWTCGKDGQSVPVSLGIPTVRVSAVTVGGVNPG